MHFGGSCFRLNGTSFNFSSSYYPQTDRQSEVVNRTLEMYLRCFTSSKPKDSMRWLPWVEYYYNTSWHSTIKRTHFEVVYGRSPPRLLSYIPGTARVEAVEKELLQRDKVLKTVHECIQRAQDKMKKVYDSKHRDKEFKVGDWMYLKLQPYRHMSLIGRKNFKLSARFYGPYQILERIGKVAYRLKLPTSSKIHPVFHVSILKARIGQECEVLEDLPVLNQEEELVPLPQALLDQRSRKGKKEVLVNWKGLSPAKATWEVQDLIQETLSKLHP